MIIRRFVNSTLLLPLAIALTLMGSGDVPSAWAFRRALPPVYWGGPRLHSLPGEPMQIRHGGDAFFFHRGWFYRRGGAGLVLVEPPIGVVVSSLPVGFVTLTLGGLLYYELNGVYYRRVTDGYVVVEPPVVVERPNPAVSGDRIVVQTDLLNVRTGPGLDQEVMDQVSRGSVLRVIGKEPGWYYVELPDGSRGWVMEQFTVPARVQPNG